MNKGDIMLCSMRRNESWLFSFVRSLFQFLSMIFRVMYCMIFILILDDKLLQRHWFYDVSIEYYTVHRIHNSQYSDIFLALSVHRLADMKPPLYEYVISCAADFFFFRNRPKKTCRDIFPREDISLIIISKSLSSINFIDLLQILISIRTLINDSFIRLPTSVRIEYPNKVSFYGREKRGIRSTYPRPIVN